MAKFSREARERVEDIWSSILKHPFIIEMAEATIPREKILYYLGQDDVYLEDTLSVMSLASAKSRKPEVKRFMIDALKATIEGEMEMHKRLTEILGVERARETRYAPTCLAYTSYMLRVAYEGSDAEILAVITPCFWTYQDLGEVLKGSRGEEDPIIRLWIEAYTSSEYIDLVSKLLYYLDSLAEEVSDAERSRMLKHFRRATWYELKFWDMSYRMEELLD